MRRILSIVLVSACASTGLAQGSLQSLTPMGVFVQADARPANHTTRGAGLPVTTQRPLQVRADLIESGTTVAHARTKASLRDLEGLPAVRIFEAGVLAAGTSSRTRQLGTAAAGGSTPTALVPHAWLLEHTGKPGDRFRVQVRLRGGYAGRDNSSTPTRVDGRARVDVGNDGSIEFDQVLDTDRHLQNDVVTVGASGRVQVKIETAARIHSLGATAASYEMVLDVSLEPVGGTLSSVTPHGTCGPDVYGVAWETGSNRSLRVVLEGAAPTAPAVLLLGADHIDLPVAGVRCNLLTTPFQILPLQTSSLGRAIVDFQGFPASMLLDVEFQFGTFTAVTQLSKGLRFEVRTASSNAFDPADVNHILSTGQSLAIGGLGSPVLSTTQQHGNLMFSNGVTGLSNDFAPLVEDFWETMSSGMSDLVSSFYKRSFNDSQAPTRTDNHVTLTSVHASGGLPYTLLRKGTQPFATGISQFRTAKGVAQARRQSYRVRCVTNVHGETDHTFQNPHYAANMIEWQRDYEAEIQSRGQTTPVPMLHSQMSSFTRYASATSLIPQGQLDASVQWPRKLPLVMPKYILDYFDGVHLTSQGYRHMGEYYAKVYTYTILEGGTWEPLRPLTAELSGDRIYVRFHVPEPPLVLDTTRVTDPGNFGFEYTDDSGQPPTITGVHLIDEDTVAILLSAPPAPGTLRSVAYAHTGQAGAKAGATTGARGCLRDSDPTPSLHNGPLFNWCVHFKMNVR